MPFPSPIHKSIHNESIKPSETRHHSVKWHLLDTKAPHALKGLKCCPNRQETHGYSKVTPLLDLSKPFAAKNARMRVV